MLRCVKLVFWFDAVNFELELAKMMMRCAGQGCVVIGWMRRRGSTSDFWRMFEIRLLSDM